MRVVIQRVARSSVTIDGKRTAATGSGLLVLAGFSGNDNDEDLEWIAGKIVRLRVFDDSDGVMNLPVTETGGEVLLISQFTLYAKTKKGNRPSYIDAAPPEIAIPLYEKFIVLLETMLPGRVKTGEFGAEMAVELINDGPVTIIIDSKTRE
ncbi:MAG: D-tyrosyl-tRNA(Tyr) deacylase [Bacteroidales bacterium]|nr:D-tyrosyl-tRNA(Tyr) deacylase [Bacteroidales bacterium]